MAARQSYSYPVPRSPSLRLEGEETGVALSREVRQARDDLAGAFSGYGGGSYCPEGIPVEQAIFGILAAFAASFGFLFRAITMITNPKRRKRSSEDGGVSGQQVSFAEVMQDTLWMGRADYTST